MRHRIFRIAEARAGARNRARIATLQESLLSLWEADYRQVVGLLGSELKNYRRSYERDFTGRWRASTRRELGLAIMSADLVFGGDFHTLPASQRLPIRLLRNPMDDGRPVTLALEMLHSEDQEAVDEFLAGRIGASKLRERIGFDHRWGFDWLQYRPLLDFARKAGISVLAINTSPGRTRGRLARRDRFAAARILDHAQNHPGGLIYVLAGDWHVARSHLPRQVAAEAGRRGLTVRAVILHQNHESLYRRFNGNGSDPVDVVRRGRDLFCVLNATPLVKAQSHLRWAWRERLARRGSADDEFGAMLPDPVSTFHHIAEALATHLRVPWNGSPLRVYGPEGAEYLDSLARDEGLSESARRRCLRRLAAGSDVYLPKMKALFLGDVLLNHVAEQAARRLCRRPEPAHRGTREENFYRWAVDCGVAFFASRLINPKRKCDLPSDLLHRRGESAVTRSERMWGRLLLTRTGVPVPPGSGHPFWNLSTAQRRRVARSVGHAWGYGLYEAYVAGLVDAAWIRRLFASPAGPATARQHYIDGLALTWNSIPFQSKAHLL